MKQVKLIMVTGENNNKYYNMIDNGDGTFTSTWGRVDVTKMTKNYPINKWENTYRTKIKKGYKDVTDLFKEVQITQGGTEVVDIKDSRVRDFFIQLQNYSNKSIQTNYKVSSEQVTQLQVDKAQSILDEISNEVKGCNNIVKVNQLFVELFHVIPRRMKKVQDNLLKSGYTKDDAQRLVKNEQDNLDVMAQQVTTKLIKNDHVNKQINVLEQMGLEVIPATLEEENEIKKLMGPEVNMFNRAFAVKNINTFDKFRNFVEIKQNKKRELFWHGSRNENWLNIMQSGLKIRPTGVVITGAMFGHGTYFADKFRKSLGYTSRRGSYWTGGNSDIGILALFEVHVGNQLQIKHHQQWCNNLNEKKLKEKGNYDSLFAQGGADLINNEYIVYNEAQTTIRFIVEVK